MIHGARPVEVAYPKVATIKVFFGEEDLVPQMWVYGRGRDMQDLLREVIEWFHIEAENLRRWGNPIVVLPKTNARLCCDVAGVQLCLDERIEGDFDAIVRQASERISSLIEQTEQVPVNGAEPQGEHRLLSPYTWLVWMKGHGHASIINDPIHRRRRKEKTHL